MLGLRVKEQETNKLGRVCACECVCVCVLLGMARKKSVCMAVTVNVTISSVIALHVREPHGRFVPAIIKT